MKKLRVIKKGSNRKLSVRVKKAAAEAGEFSWPDGEPIDPENMLLTLLLPSAVKELYRELAKEVEQLCGQRHARGSGLVRWGSQGGSVYLGRQQVAIERPRVRSLTENKEQKLSSYERFQNPRGFEAQVFRDGLRHISQRDYEGGVEKIGGALGFKKSEQKYTVHNDDKRTAVRIRCYVHKWRNLEDILGKDSPALTEASTLFWAMRDAKDLTEAKAYAVSLERVLKKANVSALRSFQEAKPDLLVIHCLGLSALLRRFFSTTNPIESLNSLLEEDLRRVKRWRDSEHFQRWLATAALANEKRMRKVRGFRGLGNLLAALSRLCAKQKVDSNRLAA